MASQQGPLLTFQVTDRVVRVQAGVGEPAWRCFCLMLCPVTPHATASCDCAGVPLTGHTAQMLTNVSCVGGQSLQPPAFSPLRAHL